MSIGYAERNDRLATSMQDAKTEEDSNYFREKLVVNNMALVSSVLQKYKPYTQDQFQEGCLGLMRAAESFDPELGVPFSSYAWFCIERSIQSYWRASQNTIEERESFYYLDDVTGLEGEGVQSNHELISCDDATRAIEDITRDDELNYISTKIIRPVIEEVADRGRNAQTKIDLDEWIEWEHLYFLELIAISSQQDRLNLTRMSEILGVSITNLRNRHETVFAQVFEKVWHYMNITFTELLARLRGDKRIPEVLLTLDPGKTTGWAVFVDGELAEAGQAEDCWRKDETVNLKPIQELFDRFSPTQVVYEDYKVYSNKLATHSYSSVATVRVIGAIETLCELGDIPYHKQMASTAKAFVTDEKLKMWQFYDRAPGHGRDAMRHGCYYLLFHKKGKHLC